MSPAGPQNQNTFSYFASDPDTQQLTGHPSDMHQFFGQMHTFPPTPGEQQPIYQPQPVMSMHQIATTNAFRGSFSMTPIASPQPSHLKPAIIVQQGSPALLPLDTRFVNADYYNNFPTTPPLSTSGSTISSPPSTIDPLHTPLTGFFSFEKVEGVKEGCESDVHSEILASVDWSRADSPPLTPGEYSRSSFFAICCFF